ncbi:MAG: tripartite tricarboxylate transporter substrate-binding protein [Pseudomonadota bacterium]
MQRRTFLGAGALASAGFPAWSQNSGNTVVWSGFPSGGLGDQVSRPLMDQLRGKYPQNLVYDTKPGAGGRIAAEFVKRAAPDGSNLLQCPGGVLTLHPHVFKKLNYDPLGDFVAVAGLCNFTFAFTAGPGLPAHIKTVADYVAWAKANPSQANYGVPSTGTSLHMAGMLLSRDAGLSMNVIPYKGGGPLLTDLLGGQVPVSFNVVSEVLPHAAAGKLRILAVTSPTRWKALPDTPTLHELGYKDIAFVEWLGWFAPAATPVAKMAALNAAVNEQIKTAAMAEVFQRNALEPLGGSMPSLTALTKKDHEYWGRMVKATGFTPED